MIFVLVWCYDVPVKIGNLTGGINVPVITNNQIVGWCMKGGTFELLRTEVRT